MTEITQKPILCIGASLVNGIAPDALPFATNFGSYRGLGDALIEKGALVINEGIGGAASFDYDADIFGTTVSFKGYQFQIDKALSRVLNPGTGTYNAKYAVICLPGNGFHDAFPDFPLDLAKIDAMIDTLIAIGNQLLALGIIPIFDIYMDYNEIDVARFADLPFITGVIDEATWNELAARHLDRISAELPNAIQVDMWSGYSDLGDGIHPDLETSEKAAELILAAIAGHEAQ